MAEGVATPRRFAPISLLLATIILCLLAILLLSVRPRAGTDTTLQQWAFLLGWLAWICSFLSVIAGGVSSWRARRVRWWLAVAIPLFAGLTWLWMEIPRAMLSPP